MNRVRKIFFWLHLLVGATAGTVILVMAVTGVLLMYERQMMEWANAGLRATPPAGATRLPLGAFLAAIAEESGSVSPPTAVSWQADPAAPVAASFGRERTLFFNAYTAANLGEGATGWRDFFRVTTDVHRWLALAGDARNTGKAITGACNLAFLFLVLSGVYLWWPRQLRWPAVKAVVLFDRSLSGKARDWNWHNVLGFWSSLPLVVIVATGVVMSYPWANNLLFRLAGSEPPAVRAREGGPRGGEGNRGRQNGNWSMNFAAFDRMGHRAEDAVIGWQKISWRQPATFMIDQLHRGRPDLRTTMTFKPGTGEIGSEESFAQQNPGRRWRAWFRWFHTGEAGGFLGQTLAGLASAAAAVLVWTGLSLSSRRFFAWRRRCRTNAPVTAAECTTHL